MDLVGWFVAGGAFAVPAIAYARARRALRAAQKHDDEGRNLFTTIVESAPMAIVILRTSGTIIVANKVAQELFFEGRDPDGQNFLELMNNAPAPFREALIGEEDAIFTVGAEGERETYHLAKRTMQWSGELTLILVRHITRELRRQEVAVWKKLLRVISHELNNSLAPISSMAHTARLIAKNPEKAHLLDGVFETIEDRTKHLSDFLASYVDLAKLPAPRCAYVSLADLVRRIAAAYPRAKPGELAKGTAWIDEAQVEQVLVNLLKNALEASGEGDVEIAVPSASELVVRDRGPGMSDDVLANALLPFYSTKERGTGLGLALCREIVEAHDGKIRLVNRDGGGLEVTCAFPDPARRAATQTRLTVTRA